MNMKKIWILPFLLMALVACNDDDDAGNMDYVNGASDMRVKRIAGQNEVWGEYELLFEYRPDGRVDHVWRLATGGEFVGDTLGYFSVTYDVDYHEFQIIDRVMNIMADSVESLRQLYPDTYRDTLRERRLEQMLYSSKLENGKYSCHVNRPRRRTEFGNLFYPQYMNVSGQTLIVENDEAGRPIVIRCYDDEYGDAYENNTYTRSISKYEIAYEGNEMVSAVQYRPGGYGEESWVEWRRLDFSSYQNIVTAVESEFYRMRRDSKQVVVAEPGKNTTYTLNEKGLAISMETTDGEKATFEYENGSGNFVELYATPLERLLGKAWVR